MTGGRFATSGYQSKSAELYDPATGAWAATGSMSTGRYDHAAAVLFSNGTVLVAGGVNGRGFRALAELYDPVAGTWATTGSMNSARVNPYDDPAAQYQRASPGRGRRQRRFGGDLLLHGRGLAPDCGDATRRAPTISPRCYPTAPSWWREAQTAPSLSTAEIYNPGAGTWTATGSMTAARQNHTATLLANGTVLVAGGTNGSILSTAELYSAGAWSATGAMTTTREWHTATLLPDGRVLAAGGSNDGTNSLNTGELSIRSGTWTAASGTMYNGPLQPHGDAHAQREGLGGGRRQ